MGIQIYDLTIYNDKKEEVPLFSVVPPSLFKNHVYIALNDKFVFINRTDVQKVMDYVLKHSPFNVRVHLVK
jgi:hypothetical protein